MPNIKSAKKRVKVIKKKTLQNQIIKSQLKTAIKKFEASLKQGQAAAPMLTRLLLRRQIRLLRKVFFIRTLHLAERASIQICLTKSRSIIKI